MVIEADGTGCRAEKSPGPAMPKDRFTELMDNGILPFVYFI